MDEETKKPTRKSGRHLRVPVLPEEETLIKQKAANAGCSIAEYLRRVGLGYQIKSTIDKDYILDMTKINADLGRLGGLLKLWLSNDKRVAHFDKKNIDFLLDKIKATQDEMLKVVKKL